MNINNVRKLAKVALKASLTVAALSATFVLGHDMGQGGAK